MTKDALGGTTAEGGQSVRVQGSNSTGPTVEVEAPTTVNPSGFDSDSELFPDERAAGPLTNAFQSAQRFKDGMK